MLPHATGGGASRGWTVTVASRPIPESPRLASEVRVSIPLPHQVQKNPVKMCSGWDDGLPLLSGRAPGRAHWAGSHVSDAKGLERWASGHDKGTNRIAGKCLGVVDVGLQLPVGPRQAPESDMRAAWSGADCQSVQGLRLCERCKHLVLTGSARDKCGIGMHAGDSGIVAQCLVPVIGTHRLADTCSHPLGAAVHHSSAKPQDVCTRDGSRRTCTSNVSTQFSNDSLVAIG